MGYCASTIRPSIGSTMAGYSDRTGGALGVHDPLEARALWFDDGDRQIGLVGIDVIAVDGALAHEVERRAGAGSKDVALVVAASHTHSGPLTARDWGLQERERIEAAELSHLILPAAVDALEGARENAVPARLSWACGRVDGFATNRRNPRAPGGGIVSVMSAQADDGEPIAGLLHTACHPTVLDATNQYLSADFPGTARRVFEESTGMPAVFINGAAGDVSTRFTRLSSSFEEVERLGRLLGDRGAEIALHAKVIGSRLGFSRDRLTLRARTRPFAKCAEQRVEASRVALDEARSSDMPAAEIRLAKVRLIGAQKSLRMTGGQWPEEIEVGVTVLNIGGVMLVCLPGEPLTSVAAAVGESTETAVRTVGYANGYWGYIGFFGSDGGGYEEDSSILSRDSVDKLTAACRRLATEAS